jgi:hypothetical protein
VGAGKECSALRARLDDPCHCLVQVSASSLATLDALAGEWSARGCTPSELCNRTCLTPSP